MFFIIISQNEFDLHNHSEQIREKEIWFAYFLINSDTKQLLGILCEKILNGK